MADKSKGEIEVQLFPAAQLGSERDMVEGLQLGSLEMTLTSTGPLGNFVPQIKLFNLPFLFKDRESCYKVLDGPIGTDIAALFKKSASAPWAGMKMVSAISPTPRDLSKNLRI